MSVPVREQLTPLPGGLAGYQPPAVRPQSTKPGAPVITPPRPVRPGMDLAGDMPAGGSVRIEGGPSAQMTSYTAENNLRGTQIAPGTNPQVTGANNQALAGYGRAATGVQNATATSGAANQARTMALTDLQGLGGPDRGKLAADAFETIEARGQPQFQKDLQNVGRKAAALGRLGAGMTTSELGDVMTTRQRDLDLTKRELATDAAGRTLDDKLGVYDARLRGSGQFTQEDLGRGGFELDRAQLNRGIGSDYADFADRQFDRDFTERQELRGERDFQNNMSREAFDQMVRQRQLEEMLLSGEWGRDMGYLQTLIGSGYGG